MNWTHEVTSHIQIGDAPKTPLEIVLDEGTPVADEGDWYEIWLDRGIIRLDKNLPECESIKQVRKG